MGRVKTEHTQTKPTPFTRETEADYSNFSSSASIRSEAALTDQLFIIACALRCRTLPCMMNKIAKNRDLLTRQTEAYLKAHGYEEDFDGLTPGSLFKIITPEGDGILKTAQIIKESEGAITPWGCVFAPTGSGIKEASQDILEAVNYASAKVEALAKTIYIQVEFLRADPNLKILSTLIHDSVVHYDDAKELVKNNKEFAIDFIRMFGIDSSGTQVMSQHVMMG